MHESVTVVVPPDVEPLSLEEAKIHLRVDGADQDLRINALIKAARTYAEGVLGRALITQTLKLTLDDWPTGPTFHLVQAPSVKVPPIYLPMAPLQEVESVTYVDQAGVVQTLPEEDYVVDASGLRPRIAPAPGRSWPAGTNRIGAVVIQFISGFGDNPTDVPETIRQAMLLLIGHWFDRREETVLGVTVAEVPFAAKALLDLEKVP